MKLFRSIDNKDDLDTFFLFFGFNFDGTKKNLFKDDLHKFKPVGAFFRGDTVMPADETVYFAAILVGFQPRPFNRFKKEIEDNELKIIRQTNEISSSVKEISLVDVIEEIKDENFNEEILEESSTQVFQPMPKPIKINLFVNARERILYNFKNRLKKTAGATILIFGLIGAVIYFAFFKNHCMQWSEDHYDVVDCSSKDNGNPNEIIPLDESLLDFKKLKACDTTTCFKKNGEAFVWYGKTGNQVDFFNDNGKGRHPETNVSLRPVTHYMFNKYLKGKPCE
ncbi:hypothetical protein L1276_002955 [Flavobacterium sp. HSC-32F16]|uniref:hypothetical protein n=1 Tax=Flavobacterium sp. HSC-32F16 TaxID=2910964 RepID=UPI0020A25EA1|nr:hypothetical protein [Flavobacterium sp. HSC-32F16]MCP2027795.1 hypothetical protein [Flavobacterium sp. HSC-32F16]